MLKTVKTAFFLPFVFPKFSLPLPQILFYMNKCLLLIALCVQVVMAQQVPFTPYPQRASGAAKRQVWQKETPYHLAFRNIGPTIMSGRVVDIEGNPQNASYFYAAFASGGLWRTANNGNTFAPLFDNQDVMTIGDIAIDWAHGEKIWIGTGECNSSRSSYAGNGVYLSEDKGKSWRNVGLEETHHIGRIRIHPTNPDIVWVAAIGHLYANNPERGVFKTTDGGKTWKHTLAINDSTGVIDLVVSPENPNVLFAAAWERQRKAWNFDGEGKGSAIYKSVDGGETWNIISGPGSGFPNGENIGRIGLDIFAKNGELIYAVVDNHNLRPDDKEKQKVKPTITRQALRIMSPADFLKLSENDINAFLDYYEFPEKYTAKSIQSEVKNGKYKPAALDDFLSDADNALFDTPIIGAEVYVSQNGGTTWTRTHTQYLDNVFYTYGYYFAQIRVAPWNDQEIYVLGVPALRSMDGGKTFTAINREHIHPDHHALWFDPLKEGHFILGNDGGMDMSYDRGQSFTKLNHIPVGQFYAVNVDSMKPYNVYGGLQDNGVWMASSKSKVDESWHMTGTHPFKELYGGDGMQIMIDNRDKNTVYTGYQFGNYARLNLATHAEKGITPDHILGESPYRFNWQTPILLSRHNQDILYLGANKLMRSMNKGDTFEPISPDLTQAKHAGGNVPYGTITTIDESPFQFGLLYAGTDDGNVHVSKDGGVAWTAIHSDLPAHMWVSRIVASKHVKSRVYVTLNGYRWDNFEAWVYISENYGETWTRLGTNLPFEPVNVLREDPTNPALLYVGTDHGLYVSINGGKTFDILNNATLPNVAVHDVVIHPRDKEIVVGTHGRSIYIASVKYLQQMTDSILAKPLHIFPIDSVKYQFGWGSKGFDWTFDDTPAVAIHYFQKSATPSTFTVQNANKEVVFATTLPTSKGLNTWMYDLHFTPDAIEKLKAGIENKEVKENLKLADNGKVYLPPGKYTLLLQNGTEKTSQVLTVVAPKVKPTRAVKKTP